ncbi:MAG: hypothetical protein J6334_07700 [Kiritimatiellae bacterium]|nr:hypothetical protein [Kiritimatiellia bacterium]
MCNGFQVGVLRAVLAAVSLAVLGRAENRPDIVVGDFEDTRYDGWTVEGEAFKPRSDDALLTGGMGGVFGFHGKRLVNTYAAPGDDKATGTLTSPSFTIERRYLAFLIGGGAFPGETGIALYVDGKKVAEETGLYNVPGHGDEGLAPKYWDLAAYAGKSAKVVIFDKKAGGNWGHIKVDEIRQTDVCPDREGNVITLSLDAKPLVYSPMIFGHFIEHFDTQVYGGIFWPGSPLSDEDGFRKDVIEALRAIKVPIVRWPGGCYVSDYHWKCGVGPKREPMWNKAWAVEDPNTFGTDEYVKWCRKVGCEPYICTNAGTGSEEEMSDWVEYCNLSVGKWGRQRIANGYEKPHDVLYWSVGNENWGGHEIGAKTVEQWGPLVRESAKMMRGVDRRIKLFAAALPDERWTLPLLKTAGYLLDYVSVHGYYAWGKSITPYTECMLRTGRPEADILRTIRTLEKAGFGGGKIAIAFDEWNLRGWYHPGLGNYARGAVMDYAARRENDVASVYTMADALFSACFLNTCLRHCDIVKMACFSPIVNTRGAIFVHPNGIVKRTTYHVFWMYTHLLEKNVLPVDLRSEPLVTPRGRTPKLDAVLSVNDDKTRYVLAVVNKDPEKAAGVKLPGSLTGGSLPGELEATVLSGSSPDDFNTIGAEERVTPQKTRMKVEEGCVTIPPHTLAFVVIPVGK